MKKILLVIFVFHFLVTLPSFAQQTQEQEDDPDFFSGEGTSPLVDKIPAKPPGILIGKGLYLDTECEHALCLVDKDKTYEVVIYGQVVVNHSAFGGAYNAGAFAQNTQFQSGRLGITGTLDKNWSYKVELTSVPNTIDNIFVRRAYLAYSIPFEGETSLSILAGKQRPLFYGQDGMAADQAIYGTNSAMISNAFGLITGEGLGLYGYIPVYGDSGINIFSGGYEIPTLERTADILPRTFQNNASLIIGRLGWAVYENDDKVELIYLSGSFQHFGDIAESGVDASINVNGGVRGTLEKGPPPVTTGIFGIRGIPNQGVEIDHSTGFDVALMGQKGPFSAILEYSQINPKIVGNFPGRDPDEFFPIGIPSTEGFETSPRFYGYLFEGGWVLTKGDHREFDKKNGYLKGIKPKHCYGALEFIWRFERIFLISDGGLINNGQNNPITIVQIGTDATTYTLGFDWYLTKNLRFALDGTYLRVRGPNASRPSGLGGTIQAAYFF